MAPTDLAIMGAGAAGLAAGARARSLGLRGEIFAAAERVGGSTAFSNGNLWAPTSIDGMHERAGVGALRLPTTMLADCPRAVTFVDELGTLLPDATASA